MAPPVLRAFRGLRAVWGYRVPRALRELPVLWAPQDQQVPRDCLVPQVLRALREQLVQPVLPALRGLRAVWEYRAPQDPLVPQGPLALLAPRVLLDRLA